MIQKHNKHRTANSGLNPAAASPAAAGSPTIQRHALGPAAACSSQSTTPAASMPSVSITCTTHNSSDSSNEVAMRSSANFSWLHTQHHQQQ
jgi:hypothetical protein